MCRATKRTPSQVWAGIRFLRKIAAKEGLPPVTHARSEGFQLSEDPEVWVAYERAIFTTELHRIGNVITGIIAPHAKREPSDEWVRLVLEQLGGVKATLEVLTRMER
ncbi:RacP protein [Streptomyces mexicanus]|uniref:RacP protein n=1 Tax=Streptomyces mexicanus TaxID=178566 RepID=UPI00365EB4EA